MGLIFLGKPHPYPLSARGEGQQNGQALTILLVVVFLAVAVAVGYFIGHKQVQPSKAAATAKAAQLWTCPMHPQIIRKEPGTCPICGMNLVPMEETKAQPTGREAPKGIPEHGVVRIDPSKQQMLGVVTTIVKRRPLDRIIRTVGRVTVDESRLSDVHTKVEGWVEKLYANQTGKFVKKGQPLLTIYSPELVSTQEEYLIALRSRERLKGSPFPEIRNSGESLVASARERLRLWDITEAQIRLLEQTGAVRKTLTLYAPSTGYIMEKMVVAGMRVSPEMTLFRLSDLSQVWVEVAIYEYETPLIKVGLPATLSLQAYPGKVLRGHVTYVYPTVEPMSRTLTARLDFANPGLMLKPDMYGDVQIMTPTGTELAIPEQAVLDSGERKVVFVQQDHGTFVPREVMLGSRSAGYYPVYSGVKEGEKVVSSPNFLIDSESRFQAAVEEIGKAGRVKAPAVELPKQTESHAGHGQ